MSISPREKRVKQMTEKGYISMTPSQRASAFRAGLDSFKSAREKVLRGVNLKEGDDPRE